eukprot:9250802-Pyramimonas_sp.AAC.1
MASRSARGFGWTTSSLLALALLPRSTMTTATRVCWRKRWSFPLSCCATRRSLRRRDVQEVECASQGDSGR